MKEYDIYIYILYMYTTFLDVSCPGEDVAEARKMATAGRPTESDGLASGPSGFCARTRMHKGVLEDSWRCSQDYLGYLFDIVRHFQGWLAVQLNLSPDHLIPCANVNCCWASLFLVFQTCKWAWIVLFDAVCFGQSFRRITGWSVKHVAASLGLALSQPGTSSKTWAVWWAATENAAYHWVLLGDPGRGKGNAGCACP